MDVKRIESEIDLRLNLLSGDVLRSDTFKVLPVTLEEIRKIGYTTYSKYLSVLAIDKNEITEGSNELDEVSIFDIIIYSENDELIGVFFQALCFFLREDLDDLLVHDKYGFVFGGKTLSKAVEECNIINRDNFQDFVQIIKYQNCMIGTSEKYNANPADEKARLIAEKLRKGKDAIAKAKSKKAQNDGTVSKIDFADIVSAVSTKSNTYNKSNVWTLTMYQLYDEYKRHEAIVGYETSIMAMVQGAKIDNLQHWSARIED